MLGLNYELLPLMLINPLYKNKQLHGSLNWPYIQALSINTAKVTVIMQNPRPKELFDTTESNGKGKWQKSSRYMPK